MTLEEMLAQIVDLAQAEVECSDCRGRGWQEYGDQKETCPPCHGTGKVPDPRHASLVEALTVECTFWSYHTRPLVGRCPVCDEIGQNPGRVLHSWEDQPQGALAGVLLLWCNSQPQTVLIQQLGKELEDCFNLKAPYCDKRAAKVVLEAIQKAATHATEG